MAVAATGFFDGVHSGHRHLIDTLVSSARRRGEESVVVSFSRHPRTVLQQDARELRLLSSMQEKLDMIRSCGVDKVELLEFTHAFAAMNAERYLREILIDRYGVSMVVLGYDTRIGSDRLGPDAIAELADHLGIEVVVCPSFGDTSSTKIRHALEQGRVEDAADMLSYRYTMDGVVVAGNRLGRTIGFPTANMALYEPLKLIPGNGVYYVDVEVCGRQFQGMTNIGCRPTVSEGGGRTIETHIFGFDEDIYGLDIKIRFIRRIRNEMRFESLEELKLQLKKDKEVCGFE